MPMTNPSGKPRRCAPDDGSVKGRADGCAASPALGSALVGPAADAGAVDARAVGRTDGESAAVVTDPDLDAEADGTAAEERRDAVGVGAVVRRGVVDVFGAGLFTVSPHPVFG
jgi:hypothetical protein